MELLAQLARYEAAFGVLVGGGGSGGGSITARPAPVSYDAGSDGAPKGMAQAAVGAVADKLGAARNSKVVAMGAKVGKWGGGKIGRKIAFEEHLDIRDFTAASGPSTLRLLSDGWG